jgi:hypothetical protein
VTTLKNRTVRYETSQKFDISVPAEYFVRSSENVTYEFLVWVRIFTQLLAENSRTCLICHVVQLRSSCLCSLSRERSTLYYTFTSFVLKHLEARRSNQQRCARCVSLYWNNKWIDEHVDTPSTISNVCGNELLCATIRDFELMTSLTETVIRVWVYPALEICSEGTINKPQRGHPQRDHPPSDTTDVAEERARVSPHALRNKQFVYVVSHQQSKIIGAANTFISRDNRQADTDVRKNGIS